MNIADQLIRFTTDEARTIIAKVENITGPFPPGDPYYIGTQQL